MYQLGLFQFFLQGCDFCSFWTILANIATIATAIIAGRALWYSKREYNAHRDREKAENLNRYNERYSENEDIQNVVKYIYERVYDNKQNSTKDFNKIKMQLEMFLRFFEEIQFSINSKLIEDKKEVRNILAFYGMLAYEVPEIKEYIDEDPGNWERYKEFIEEMNKIKKLTDDDLGNLKSTENVTDDKSEKLKKSSNLNRK